MNKHLKTALRLFVTASILWLMLHAVDWQQSLVILKNANLHLMLWAVVTQLTSTSLAAYRWQLIMHNLRFNLRFDFYWRSYFKGMFFNQALPTSIGGDAMKVLDLARQHFRKRDALYGVMIDRIIGLAALLLLSLFAYLLNPGKLPEQVYTAIVLLNACGVLGFLSLIHLYQLPGLRKLPKLYELLHTISERLRLTFRANNVRILAISLLIPFLAVFGFFLTGWSLGLRYDLMTYFLLIPPAIVFTVLPVSIAGWGIREGALVALFGLMGANSSIVLMMSIAYGFTLIVVSLPGLFVFLRGKQKLAR